MGFKSTEFSHSSSTYLKLSVLQQGNLVQRTTQEIVGSDGSLVRLLEGSALVWELQVVSGLWELLQLAPKKDLHQILV